MIVRLNMMCGISSPMAHLVAAALLLVALSSRGANAHLDLYMDEVEAKRILGKLSDINYNKIPSIILRKAICIFKHICTDQLCRWHCAEYSRE